MLAVATGVRNDVWAEHVESEEKGPGTEPLREESGPSGVGREGFGKETEEQKEKQEREASQEPREEGCEEETGRVRWPESWPWLWHVGLGRKPRFSWFE